MGMKTIMISFMIPCSVSVFLILVSKLVEQKRTLVQKSNNLDFCLAFTAKPTASGGCGLRVGCEMKEELHWLMILNSQRKNMYPISFLLYLEFISGCHMGTE